MHDLITYLKGSARFYVLWCSLLPSIAHTAPSSTYRPPKLLNIKEREQLRTRAEHISLIVTRSGIPKSGIRFVTPRKSTGGAIFIHPKWALTAQPWLEMAPDERMVDITVRCFAQTHSTVVHASISVSSTQHGWSLLNMKHPLNCGQVNPLTLHQDNPKELAVLYALEPHPLRPSPIMIQGKAPTPLSYYIQVSGRLSAGVPLFDSQGKWVTLSSGLSRQFLDSSVTPYSSLILPQEALEAAFIKIKQMGIIDHSQRDTP